MSGLVDIEMPGGITLTDVPEGTSKADILKAYAKVAPANQLSYKQGTARMNADANAPVPTAATGLQNLGESAVDSLKGMGTQLMNNIGASPGTKRPQAPQPSLTGAVEGIAGPPLDYVKALRAGNPDAAASAGGRILTQTTPALYGAAEGIKAGAGALTADPVTAMERSLAPRGISAKATTQATAPDLVAAGEQPAGALTSQRVFDQRILDKFTQAKAGLDAAERSIPPGTMRPKAPLLSGIDKAIDDLQVAASPDPVTGAPRSISGHADAVKVLTDERTKLDSLPDNVPFEDLRKYRQQLDKAIGDSNGYSDNATAADKAAMQARKTVAGIIRDNLKGVSPELDAANQAYSTYADPAGVIQARQMADVGKPARIKQLLKKYAVPAVVGGAASLGGYEMWKSH